MLTEERARKLAAHWVQAWNSHDLAEIMSHYAEDVVLVSPAAARILNDPLGTVKGKDALRAYFKKGLEAYPNLKFDFLDLMWGLSSVVLYYAYVMAPFLRSPRSVDAGLRVGSECQLSYVDGFRQIPRRHGKHLCDPATDCRNTRAAPSLVWLDNLTRGTGR